MLKTVSSITNAIGALNFKGTWNASTNTPTLTSGVGVKGDYFVVSTAGTTNLDGISTWGVGDWATYNGTVWQRVEGGADLEGVNLSVSGTTNLAALTAATAMALDANKNVVSVTNTGTGNNVLDTSPTMATPTITGNVQMSTGDLVVGTSGKGINFSADGGGILSQKGASTVSVANGATVTLFSLTLGEVYIVNASFGDFSGGTTVALVWLPKSGNTSFSGAAILGQNGAGFTITVSGANVQLTNTVGGNVTVGWSAIKLHGG